MFPMFLKNCDYQGILQGHLGNQPVEAAGVTTKTACDADQHCRKVLSSLVKEIGVESDQISPSDDCPDMLTTNIGHAP